MDKVPWPRTNKQNPGPICGRPDGCLISPDGTTVICARVEEGSVKLIGDPFAGGWLHKLGDGALPVTGRASSYHRPKRSQPPPNFERAAYEYTRNFDPSPLAKELGVSVTSLERLWAGYNGKSYTFPMRNAKGAVIGIRTRDDYGKRCIKGSKTGLFIPRSLLSPSRLFICEGPTDTAAMLDLGFSAIGRPSCSGGVDMICLFVERSYVKEVIIVADRDEAKYRPDGTTWHPGMDGAKRLAGKLKQVIRKIKIIRPPRHKDIRQWYNNGATHEAVLALVEGTRIV